MQGAGTPGLPARQAGAKLLVACRPGEEPFQEGAQIEAGPADDNRQPAPARDLAELRPRQPEKIAGREDLVRVQDVEQVVGNPPPLFQRELRRTDV